MKLVRMFLGESLSYCCKDIVITPFCVCSEPHKAGQCFISASEGIATETFLAQKLLRGAEGSHRQLTITYYLKVISQFEEYGMADMVISLANQAICLADHDDPNVVRALIVLWLVLLVPEVFLRCLVVGSLGFP